MRGTGDDGGDGGRHGHLGWGGSDGGGGAAVNEWTWTRTGTPQGDTFTAAGSANAAPDAGNQRVNEADAHAFLQINANDDVTSGVVNQPAIWVESSAAPVSINVNATGTETVLDMVATTARDLDVNTSTDGVISISKDLTGAAATNAVTITLNDTVIDNFGTGYSIYAQELCPTGIALSIRGTTMLLDGICFDNTNGSNTITSTEGVEPVSIHNNAAAALAIIGGNAADTIELRGDMAVLGNIDLRTGDDSLLVSSTHVGAVVYGSIVGGTGNDTVTLINSSAASNQTWGTIDLGDGDDLLSISTSATATGSIAFGAITPGAGNDTVTLDGNLAPVAANIDLGTGNNSLTIRRTNADGAAPFTNIAAGIGNDTVSLTNASTDNHVYGDIDLGAGDTTITIATSSTGMILFDSIRIDGAGTANTFVLGAGNDTVTLRGLMATANNMDIDLGDGNNSLTIDRSDADPAGNFRYRDITGGAGSDSVSLTNSTAAANHAYQDIDLGTGTNSLALVNNSTGTLTINDFIGGGNDTITASRSATGGNIVVTNALLLGAGDALRTEGATIVLANGSDLSGAGFLF